MQKQLFFNLDFSPTPARTRKRTYAIGRKRKALRRAIFKWLEKDESPTGVGTNVVTRISRLKADVAAFWSTPVSNRGSEGPTRILRPDRTVIVQCHAERGDCWPDCVKSQEVLPQLKEQREKLHGFEKTIRQEEPDLRSDNTLFEEYAEWHYEDSTNPEYQRLRQAIEKMEHSIYHGTKFERIRKARLADLLYLAVPHGLVQPEELADGWGLLWVEDDLTVKEMSPAEDRQCLERNRMHLIQNIAAAGKAAVLASLGVSTAGRKTHFVKPLRKHIKPQKVSYSEI